MDENKQLELIKEFMMALAPEVAHHRFALIRHRQLMLPVNEEGDIEHASFALQNAKLTLEMAMHLAGQYGTCYDSLHSEEARPPKKTPPHDPPRQPPPGAPIAPVRRSAQDVPF
jgi:hypothetical protein